MLLAFLPSCQFSSVWDFLAHFGIFWDSLCHVFVTRAFFPAIGYRKFCVDYATSPKISIAVLDFLLKTKFHKDR